MPFDRISGDSAQKVKTAKKETPEMLALISEAVLYDAYTGSLTWKRRPRNHFASDRACNSWNSRYPNFPAFATVNHHGYLVGAVFDTQFLAHRVCWACHHGYWPKLEIDHINRVKDDNRMENLRDVTASINMLNRAPFGKTPLPGVTRRKWSWRVLLSHANGRYVGTYTCLGDAIRARSIAKKESETASYNHAGAM